ncbi:branched-chain amino acid ABC transporter permease [Azospirillum endophyticum]
MDVSRKARIVGLAGAGAVVLLLIAPMLLKSFLVFQLTIIIVYGLAVLALNVLTGWSGQFSLGNSAFFAAGAYIMGILMESFGFNFMVALPVAGLVCFLFGFLFGFPALRLSGIYLALATFALAVAFPQFTKLHYFEPWTGGAQGIVIQRPEAPAMFGMDQDSFLYYVVLAIVVLIYGLTRNLARSRTGRAMIAIRDNEIAASALGVNLALYKTLSFGLSAGITGIAGGLAAIVVGYVSPDAYTFHFSMNLFIAMVIGGVGWLPGSFVGAAFIVLVPNIAENISKGLSGGVLGFFILAVIFLFRGGAKQAAHWLAALLARSTGLR